MNHPSHGFWISFSAVFKSHSPQFLIGFSTVFDQFLHGCSSVFPRLLLASPRFFISVPSVFFISFPNVFDQLSQSFWASCPRFLISCSAVFDQLLQCFFFIRISRCFLSASPEDQCLQSLYSFFKVFNSASPRLFNQLLKGFFQLLQSFYHCFRICEQLLSGFCSVSPWSLISFS